MKTSIITLIFLFFISSCGFNTDTDHLSNTQKPTKTPLSAEKLATSKEETLTPDQHLIPKNRAIEQESINSADIVDDPIKPLPNQNKTTTIYNAKKLRKSAEHPAIKPIIIEEDDMPRLD
ncbi:MAG: hypothetical protein V7784_05540 [Oceanospirillaceae bacterium]